MSLAIVGLGLALPEHSLPQATSGEWAREVSGRDGRARLIPALFRRTGVRRRYAVVLEGDPVRQSFFAPARGAGDGGPRTRERMERYAVDAPVLALEAARRALAGSRDVTHLVTVSCSGSSAPGFDVRLVRDLGLPAGTARTHIGFMGCHGALNGLRVARAFVEADPASRVLLCAVELCSLHYDYGGGADRIVANALFADGAAALLATSGPGRWHLGASGSCLLPDSEDLLTWTIGDHGFEIGLSARVPDVLGQHLRPWLEEWLARHGLPIASVASWAIHPGGPRILTAAEEALGLTPAATADSRAVFEAHGNMSSPTVLFILDRLRRRDAPLPCVALGFGPGLTLEAALFR